MGVFMTRERKLVNANSITQVIMFFFLIAFDQFTKAWVVATLKDKPAVPFIKDIIEFQYLENRGAAFGTLQGKQTFFYIITVVVVALVIVAWAVIIGKMKKYLKKAEADPSIFKKKTFNEYTFINYFLTVLAAGAIGNFIDRIVNQYVVDFIYFKIINFPLFNFADCCVTISAFAFIIFFLFSFKEDENLSVFGTGKKKK